MSTTTPNLGLFKYDPATDGNLTFDIAQAINGPLDKIDAALQLQSMNRQAIINGNFDVWQRGTSFPINNLYTADRWHIGVIAATAPGAVSRQSFSLGQTEVSNNPKYFMRINPTGLTGCTYFVLEQVIEGVEVFSGGKATLSFWAKSDSAQNISAQLIQNFGTGGSPSGEVADATVLKSVGTSWVKYSITFNVPSVSGKTIGTNGDSSLKVIINLPQNGTYSLDIAQVQLCAGDVALPFQPRSFADELQLCQRYYEKSYSQPVAPGTATILGVSGMAPGLDAITIAGSKFSVKKRIAPTVIIYSQNGTINKATASGGADTAAATALIISDGGFATIGSSVIVTTSYYYYHFTADAEL